MRLLITSTEVMMYQFLIPHVKFLVNQGIEVAVACSEVEGHFDEVNKALSNIAEIHKISSTRSPLSFRNLIALFELRKLIDILTPDVIWTNEPVIGVLTRLANISYGRKRKKIIYFAHGFHFFKGAPLINWLIYFPIEYVLSYTTDCLITINKEDFKIASKRFKTPEIKLFPGIGVDVSHYMRNSKVHRDIKNLPYIEPGTKIILSVGELEKRKNHLTSILAFSKINNEKVLFLICGVGSQHTFLQSIINQLSLEERVKLLGYRTDVSDLLEIADVFLFSTFQEGLSKALMEAMAKGCICVCSRIRGNVDLLDESSALFFSPHCVNDCANALKKSLYGEGVKEEAIVHNLEQIKKFDISIVVRLMAETIVNIYVE